MLQVAIIAVFTILCIFQPWFALVFVFFWLIEKSYQKRVEEDLEMRQQMQRDLLEKIDSIFEEEDFDDWVQVGDVEVRGDETVTIRAKKKPRNVSHLRLVK